jgi:hypothetical protein
VRVFALIAIVAARKHVRIELFVIVSVERHLLRRHAIKRIEFDLLLVDMFESRAKQLPFSASGLVDEELQRCFKAAAVNSANSGRSAMRSHEALPFASAPTSSRRRSSSGVW